MIKGRTEVVQSVKYMQVLAGTNFIITIDELQPHSTNEWARIRSSTCSPALEKTTNDRALFAMFARSNLNFQEPGNGDTKLSGKGRGEDTCYMSHVILAKLET